MNKKRKGFLTTYNKYQEKIVLLSFIPSFCILFVFTVSLFFIRSEIVNNVRNGVHLNYAFVLMHWIHHSYNYIIWGVCGIFILSAIWAFKIAHELLGAFNRIIKELDEVIEGRRTKSISARPEDGLAQELLKRINVLAQHYIDHKK
jgi:hypothetical protein